MTGKQTSSWVRSISWLVPASLVAGGVTLAVPQVRADEARRGSVRHADKARPANPRGAADPRGARDPRGVADPRGARDPRGRYDPRGPADPRSSSRAGARAGYAAGYRHGRYSAWEDARRDYRRWRAITGLFKLGVYLATKPPKTTTVVVTGTTYYYSGGVFLVTSGTGYVVASAPPGAVIYAVPVGTTVIHVGSTPYYYYGGTFYVVSSTPAQAPPPAPAATAPAATTTAVASTAKEQSLGDVEMIEDDQSYEVVTPPVGATVPYLPEEASEATVGGKKYFVHNDTYYRPFASDGETIYMIVDDPRKSPA